MKDISTALRTRMQEAAESLSLPVAWPLEEFTPPDGDWLEFVFRAASDYPLSQGPGGLNNIVGFIRITVHCKQREGVSSDALFYGDSLRAFFTIPSCCHVSNSPVNLPVSRMSSPSLTPIFRRCLTRQLALTCKSPVKPIQQ